MRFKQDGAGIFLLMGLVLFLLGAGPAPGDSAQDRETDPGVLSANELLRQSLTSNLTGERRRLEDVFAKRKALSEKLSQYRRDLDEYRRQLSLQQTVSNLPRFDEYTWRQVRIENQAIVNEMAGRQQELARQMEDIQQQINRARAFLDTYRSQQSAFSSKRSQADRENSITAQLQKLTHLLSTQEEVLVSLQGECQAVYETYAALGQKFSEMADRVHRQLETQTTGNLFQKEVPVPLVFFDQTLYFQEVQRLREAFGPLLSLSYWQQPEVPDPGTYVLLLTMFFGWLIGLELLLAWARRPLRRWRDQCWQRGDFWQYLVIRLLRRSLLILGAVFLIRFYPVPPSYQLTAFFRILNLVQSILIITLLTRWGINFIRVIRLHSRYVFFHALGGYFRVLFYGLFVVATGYTLIHWALGDSARLLLVLRLCGGGLLLGWSLFFWRRFHRYFRFSPHTAGARGRYLRFWPPFFGFALVLGGLLVDLLGFHVLAAYWYQSWTISAALALWIVILYMLLREVEGTVPSVPLPGGAPVTEESNTGPEVDDEEKPTPFRWLLIRLAKMGLALMLVLGLPLAWGGRRLFFADFFKAVDYQVVLGTMRVSLLDVVLAIFFVMIFHSLVAIWKSLLKEKILPRRQIDPGLQDAIATISGYVLWVIGLLIVLRIVGISVASLAVFAGALGIGLGFGLQNIFNNFLSGIILLFERPMKVGDVIDLNGTVGEVKKINVRSTRVKTYENTDLIIPNSQFISDKLTNWSFKDAKIRRTITVGVAYGSDTQLVRDTLMNIAFQHPRVFHRPLPQVLFSDFGDSSLVFKLRFWANIDYFISVETDLRFEIDQQFRQLGIVIPFPQRDVYLKTAPDAPDDPPDPSD